jgi:signal transduction histidine kinase
VLDDKGRATYICGICRDVTERKKNEQLKDGLIRNISHELKTPIAVASMAYEMCQRGIKSGDMDRIKKALAAQLLGQD